MKLVKLDVLIIQKFFRLQFNLSLLFSLEKIMVNLFFPGLSLPFSDYLLIFRLFLIRFVLFRVYVILIIIDSSLLVISLVLWLFDVDGHLVV